MSGSQIRFNATCKNWNRELALRKRLSPERSEEPLNSGFEPTLSNLASLA